MLQITVTLKHFAFLRFFEIRIVVMKHFSLGYEPKYWNGILVERESFPFGDMAVFKIVHPLQCRVEA